MVTEDAVESWSTTVACRITAVMVMTLLGCSGCTKDPGGSDGPAFCGNGVWEDGEACDVYDLGQQTCVSLGFAGGLLACAVDCTLDTAGCEIVPGCGNGYLDPDEPCDGEDLAGQTCESFGLVGDGPTCTAACQLDMSACVVPGICGNGLVDPGEVCDDGNSLGGDGCSADCVSDEICGNFFVDTALGEVCDDGNTTSGDGCSADCTRDETLCGNGVVDPLEVCDDGNLASHDGCSSGCTAEMRQWIDLGPAAGPGPREGHVMAYDQSRDRVVLFGGRNAVGATLQDTWEFDGAGWQNVTPAVSPASRELAVMAYDSLRHRTVLVGGQRQGTNLQDTWGWDGSQWSQLLASGGPDQRHWAAMVYDTLRDRLVLFGGYNAVSLADTWEFDGSGWTEITPAWSPQARHGHALAYDSTQGAVVLFGGGHFAGSSLEFLDDAWEYSGWQWVQTTILASPAPRLSAGATFDAWRDRTVLLGGAAGQNPYPETWEYQSAPSATWSPVSPNPSPPARQGGPLVYDSRRRRVVLYGGKDAQSLHSDTWAYQLTSTWPEEICHSGTDADLDGLIDCADPDCQDQPCAGGTCVAGSCQ